MYPQIKSFIIDNSGVKQVRCVGSFRKLYKSAGLLGFPFVGVITKISKNKKTPFIKGSLVKSIFVSSKFFIRLNVFQTGFYFKQITNQSILFGKRSSGSSYQTQHSTKIYGLVSFCLKQRGYYKFYSISEKKIF